MGDTPRPKEVTIPELNDGLSIQEQPNGGNHPDEVVRFGCCKGSQVKALAKYAPCVRGARF